MQPAPTARRVATRTRTTLAALAFAALFSGAPEARAQAATATLQCQGWQWVADSAGACPSGSQWSGAPLFSPPIPGLQSYCVYTWTGTTAPLNSDLQDLDTLAGAATVTTLTEDCPVVYPQSGSYDVESSQFLRSELRAHVGSADLVPEQYSDPAPPDVRVVIVDTAPDGASGQIPLGEDPHGYNLAHVVKDIVCSSSDCFAEVTTSLALPRTSTGTTNMSQGGHSGTLSDLAGAIHRAILAWQQDPVPHLILNLSVGWEDFPGIADCTEDSGMMRPPARAVHDVLQAAVKMGALVIAAAGNTTDGPSPPQGLICPAKWQTIPTQTYPYGSLVFASHGIDYRNLPLTNARPSGLSAFGALGFGGAAWKQGDPIPPALIGSSVAAAVLSAVSAVVWALQPGWEGSDVLQAVYEGGVPPGSQTGEITHCPTSLGSTNPIQLAPSCTPARVSLCGALAHMLGPVSCQTASALTYTQPSLSTNVALALAPSLAALPSSALLQPSSDGNPERLDYPSRQSTPAIFPQPLYPRCPTCAVLNPGFGAVSNPAALYVSSSAALGDVTLVVTTSGGQTLNFRMSITSATASIALDFLSLNGPVTSAYLTGMDQGFSWTAPLLVQ